MSRVSYLQSIWQVCKVHKFHLSSTFPRCECGRRESAVLPDVYLTCHRWTRDTCPSQHNLDAKLESLSADCRLVSSDTTAIFTPNRDLTICRLAGPSPGLESWTWAEVTAGEINLDKIGNVQCAIKYIPPYLFIRRPSYTPRTKLKHYVSYVSMYSCINIYLRYLHQCKIFTIRRQNHDWFPFYLIEKLLIKSF